MLDELIKDVTVSNFAIILRYSYGSNLSSVEFRQ